MKLTQAQTDKIKSDLTPVDVEASFSEMLDDCFGTVSIAGYEYETSRALKEIDPVAFRCGVADYTGNDDQFLELDGEYYHAREVEDLIEEMESENENSNS